MILLKEEAFFQNTAIPVFNKIYQALDNYDGNIESVARDVLDEREYQIFDTNFEQLLKRCNSNRSAIDYEILFKYAALGGNDSLKNPILLYLTHLEDDVWENYIPYIEYVCEQMEKGEINSLSSDKDTPTYLYNSSLYTRGDQEFKYAVYAFNIFQDASLVKKFFPDVKPINGKNYVLLNLSESEFLQLFDNEAQLNPDVYNLDQNYTRSEETINAYIEFSDRFFYKDKRVSESTMIIPSGVNSTYGRNIWHYMDLYSEGVNESDLEQHLEKDKSDNKERTKEDTIIEIKDLLRNHPFNKDARNQINALLNDL